jgi:hypothetical protein
MVILFRVVKQFCRFWIWSETECKTPAEYVLQYNSTPSHPPHSHTLSVCTVHLVWEGGGKGGQRKGRVATVVHKYSSFVHGGKFTSWVENTNHEWMYLQSIKSVRHNAAKSISRSILKKSRHLGFGVFIVNSSMSTGIENRKFEKLPVRTKLLTYVL